LQNKFSQTFLGQLFLKDKKYAYCLSGILCVYVLIHIFRLEVYPLYMFAMYSEKIEAPDSYTSFHISKNKKKVKPGIWNYRHFTYINNTIAQYDGSVENNFYHNETKVIDKFGQRLRLNDGIMNALKAPYNISLPWEVKELAPWIESQIGSNVSISRHKYDWDGNNPVLIEQKTIYGAE